MPYTQLDKVIGRNTVINNILDKIDENNSNSLYLSAQAGIGKTEVAIEVFYKTLKKIKAGNTFITNIAWI